MNLVVGKTGIVLDLGKAKAPHENSKSKIANGVSVMPNSYFTEYPLESMQAEKALRKVSSVCCC
jgi:hypothetical protein